MKFSAFFWRFGALYIYNRKGKCPSFEKFLKKSEKILKKMLTNPAPCAIISKLLSMGKKHKVTAAYQAVRRKFVWTYGFNQRIEAPKMTFF